jgi:adenosine deaminase
VTNYLIPETTIDIQTLPKVSLHDHLDGGLRPHTIIELAEVDGVTLPVDSETGRPIDEASRLGQWFADQSDSGSLVEYLKTFDITTGVMQTAEGLARVARECVEDLADDGVVYGEIRWAPEQHLQRGLSLDAAVEAVQAGLEAGVKSVADRGHTIRVGQLVSAMRHLDRGVEIAELALRHRDKGAVGFDIAGPEAGFPPSRMAAAFELLAVNMFPVTVHAGEADGIESIRSALVDGRTLRLGHGVRIAEGISHLQADTPGDAGLDEVARWVLERQIPLETSPSSNVQTGAIAAWGPDLANHPFPHLYRLGFAVSVNTDNRLMSSTTVSKELWLLTQAFGYGVEDLLAFQLNAAAGAFLEFDAKQQLVDDLVDAYSSAALKEAL